MEKLNFEQIGWKSERRGDYLLPSLKHCIIIIYSISYFEHNGR